MFVKGSCPMFPVIVRVDLQKSNYLMTKLTTVTLCFGMHDLTLDRECQRPTSSVRGCSSGF